MSFDPRGVEHSTPKLDCFTNDLDRQAFYLHQDFTGTIDEIEHSLHVRVASSEAFGLTCNTTIMKYITTYSVAQDILVIADTLQPNIRDPLINYWGISYGTVIGNTLASAFPHRIGKFLLDGVVDVDDYLTGVWLNSLTDASLILDHFYDLCHQVGPKTCALWETTPQKIRGKVDRILRSLKSSPTPIVRDGSADILTSSNLRSIIFNALYFPRISFPKLAQALYDTLQTPANTTLIATMVPSRLIHDPRNIKPIPPTNRSIDNDFPVSSQEQKDAERIIACSDAASINDWGLSDIKHYISSLLSIFPLAADAWSATTLSCTKWPSSNRGLEYVRYTGPFNSSLAQYDLDRGARSILWIGNKADPATPLKQARAMAARHEKSRVLETGIYGHATAPFDSNQCVYEYIKNYFTHGTLTELTVRKRSGNGEFEACV